MYDKNRLKVLFKAEVVVQLCIRTFN